MKENLSHQPGMAAETVGARVQNHVKTALKIAFAVGLIAWMVHKDALDFAVFQKIGSIQLIAFCAACAMGQIFVCNYRWLTLMRGLGLHATVKESMELSLIGMFFNFAMPGGVGGDVVKGYYLIQDHRERKVAAVVSILMDRIMGFFVMVGTAFVALFLNWDRVNEVPQLKSIAIGVTLLFTAFLTFFAISLSRRIGRSRPAEFFFSKFPAGEKFRKLYVSLHTYRTAKRALAIGVLMSIGNQVFMVAFVYAVGNAMGYTHIPLSMYFFLVPIGTVVQALPLSPAGIGVGQAAFFFLFNLYLGEESQLGPTAVTLMQLMSFGWGLFGAFFYLRKKKPTALTAA